LTVSVAGVNIISKGWIRSDLGILPGAIFFFVKTMGESEEGVRKKSLLFPFYSYEIGKYEEGR
jgi:hypothetical protein